MPDFLINVKTKGAKQANLSIKSLTKSLVGIGLAYASVSKAADIVTNSINMSAELEGIKRGFDNLAKSSGFSAQTFDKLSKATDGTIDSLTLMKQANNAMLLGIAESEDQFANMFDVAQRLGQALGKDTPSSIESLVTGLGRQSKLMLDNLGIMVDVEKANSDYATAIGKTTATLTDQERKTAFTNATMEEANRLVAQLGDEQLTTRDKISQLRTAATDLAADFGELLAPSVLKIAEVLTTFARGASEFLEWANAVETVVETTDVMAKQTADSAKSLDELKSAYRHVKDEIKALVPESTSFHDAMVKSKDMGVLVHSQIQALGTEYINLKGKIKEYNISQEMSKQKQINGFEITDIQIKKQKESNLSIEDQIHLEKMRREESARSARDIIGNLGNLAGAFSKGKKVEARLAQTQAVIDTYAGANKALASAAPPFNFISAAAVIAGGLANVAKISSSIGDFKAAATGMNEVVNKPTLILAGEAGAESVNITPLTASQSQSATSGSLTINVSGNVMSPDYVEDVLADQIKEAVRKGVSFA